VGLGIPVTGQFASLHTMFSFLDYLNIVQIFAGWCLPGTANRGQLLGRPIFIFFFLFLFHFQFFCSFSFVCFSIFLFPFLFILFLFKFEKRSTVKSVQIWKIIKYKIACIQKMYVFKKMFKFKICSFQKILKFQKNKFGKNIQSKKCSKF
jgi:hypothetical protein